ncbi:right-handed parallel beta-helix repeat-containing protein [Ancylobacter sp. SL191]|uniref:right-handed parallel beta-helix repeat-containing protein n=1 Tax=Ancylobacter sp. SL191 TaxID=2995166 RepID=UPI00226EA62A|nr:right-handed parallel beta-helix repeat-containing protein [Ancylobacter sp. SL191]WAC28690.1 right-handed parallel beta-helix repeat-containing protein [Ancylobacter sp. SL191]
MPISRRSALALGASLIAMPAVAQLSAAPSRRLNATDFAITADAGEDGSGTDNRTAFQAFFTELATGGYSEAVIPGGRYAISGDLFLGSATLESLAIYGQGAEFIFTAPEPKMGARLRVAATRRQGGALHIEGLLLRHNRPTVRTGGSDMVGLSGFRAYRIEDITIPSADNMGITIGRGDAKAPRFVPESIIISGCDVGGRRESQPHSNASIGDTGIWIVSPAVETRITRCRVRETGDDGIYVGHSDAQNIRRVEIDNNDVQDSGARGIVIAVPNGHLRDNSIRRTNIAGIVCETMDGGMASDLLIERNLVVDAGTLKDNVLGQRLMKKVHPHGIFIYEPGRNITLRDNVIRTPLGDGLKILSHPLGDLSGVRLEGGSFEGIGSRPGSSSAVVLRREGNAPTRCLDVEARGVQVIDSPAPLLAWSNNAPEADGPVRLLDLALVRCRPEGGSRYVSGSGKIGGVEISYRSIGSTVDIAGGDAAFPLAVTRLK